MVVACLSGEVSRDEGRAQSFEEKKDVLTKVVQQESRSYSLEDNLQKKPKDDSKHSQCTHSL